MHDFIRDSKFHDKEFDNVMRMRSIYQKGHVNCAAAQTQGRVFFFDRQTQGSHDGKDGKTRIP